MPPPGRHVPDTISLQAALASWRDWPLPISAPPKVLGPVPGGRTNRNVKIEAPGINGPLILRLNNRRSAALGIDRDAEAQILFSAANAGIAPQPLYQDPQHRFALLPFIKARVWQAADFANTQQRARLLRLLRSVRELSPATATRSYHAYLTHYMQQLEAANAVTSELSQRWSEFVPALKAFDAAPWPAQLTHHDLIPENVLDTGGRLYLIDWEYAAIGHADIDLWCIDPALVHEPFIHELARWTNDLWERVLALPTHQQPNAPA